MHPSLWFVTFFTVFFPLNCDNPHDKSFLLSLSDMIAPSVELEGMVGGGAEQVDASANIFGILDPCDL